MRETSFFYGVFLPIIVESTTVLKKVMTKFGHEQY